MSYHCDCPECGYVGQTCEIPVQAYSESAGKLVIGNLSVVFEPGEKPVKPKPLIKVKAV